MDKRLNIKGGMFFSLVELLVVISIIALLTSLLLPMLSKAKDTARGIACKNNLLQIGTATAIYLVDWSDYFPSNWGSVGPDIFYDNLEPYTAINTAQAKNSAASAKIYYCPSDVCRTKFTGKFIYSYAMNYYAASDCEFLHMRRTINLKDPSNVIFRLDGINAENGGGFRFSVNTVPFSPSGNPSYAVEYRHGKFANSLMCDMHVTQYALTDLYGTYANYIYQYP